MKQMITLKRHQIHTGNLILVNETYPIIRPFHPPLVPVESSYAAITLQRTAAALLAGALTDLTAREKIVPVSGFRPLREQRQIYEDSLKENGREFTEKYVALPDHSEHQTGLAIDLGENKADIDFIRPDFPYEGICQEFRKRAADYGFIERYQKEKTAVTHIAHEPWHFRYVGCPHAALMQEHDMALEEYILWLKRFPYEGEHLFTRNDRYEAEIFYVPMTEDAAQTSAVPDAARTGFALTEASAVPDAARTGFALTETSARPRAAVMAHTVRIALPECTAYQVSGNNIDGCIVTLWHSRYTLPGQIRPQSRQKSMPAHDEKTKKESKRRAG